MQNTTFNFGLDIFYPINFENLNIKILNYTKFEVNIHCPLNQLFYYLHDFIKKIMNKNHVIIIC